MTTGPERRGRRDNGLSATAYTATGDVDPRVGEHLLDALALAGIAAYLRPSFDQQPLTRNTVLPDRPVDRLYVDRARLADAHELIAMVDQSDQSDQIDRDDQADQSGQADRDDRDRSGALPDDPVPGDSVTEPPGYSVTEPPGDSVTESLESRWEELVAGFHTAPPDRPARNGPASWPAEEEVDPEEPTSRPDPETSVVVRRAVPAEEFTLLDSLDRLDTLPGDDDEGYTPPPPPPLPRLSREATVALLLVAAGLLLILWPSLLPVRESVTLVLGFGALLVGFLGLLNRLRSGTDSEDEEPDPDDGAVV